MKNAIWLFMLAAGILAVFIPSYSKMQDLKAKNAEYARRIAALQKRNMELEKERHLLDTDPMYLEKVARRKMGLIRSGEKVYHLVPVTEANAQAIRAQGARALAIKAQAAKAQADNPPASRVLVIKAQPTKTPPKSAER